MRRNLTSLALLLVTTSFVHAQTSHPETISTIAFGSCLKQDRPAPIFDAINLKRPDVFIFLGDNVYADTEDMGVMREKYAQLGAIPGYQVLRQQTRVLATWDDHDYGKNDAGKEFPKRAEAKEVLLEFFGDAADSPRRTREGVYDSYTFGSAGRSVQIILLDTRSFRDALEADPSEKRVRYLPTTDTSKTILGEAQWAWLEEQLKQPCDVRVIASSIQVLAEEHKFEKWMNFPHERERLMRLIGDHAGPRIVLISGDRHFAEIARTETLAPGAVVEVTSSSLNSSGWGNRDEPNQWRVGPFVGENNAGWLSIDWERRVVRAALVGESGQTLAEHAFAIDARQPDIVAPAEVVAPPAQ